MNYLMPVNQSEALNSPVNNLHRRLYISIIQLFIQNITFEKPGLLPFKPASGTRFLNLWLYHKDLV